MVSVLLAAYNGAAFIREQMDSILSQTVEDVKIVFSDDGSSDGTLEILKEYERRFPDRVRGLYGEATGSPQGNFFRLLTSVTDDYVMLCDQDDVWLPDKVEATLKEMKRMEARYGVKTPVLVHTDLAVTDKEGKILHPSMARYQKIAVSDNRFSHYLVENNITGNTVMLNKAFGKLFHCIPLECAMHDWWLGLLASCFGRIAYLDRPLVRYRQHGGNQLGAQSGLLQLVRFQGKRERVRKNYQRMFSQARLFDEYYGDKLSPKQRETIKAFLRLPSMSRLGKIRTIVKYQLVKSTWLRTLGQMFSI